MTTTPKDIAVDAYDDVLVLEAAFKTALTYFKAIANLSPQGELLGDLARMGMQHCDDFQAHAQDIANRIDSELERINSAPQDAEVANRGAHGGGA